MNRPWILALVAACDNSPQMMMTVTPPAAFVQSDTQDATTMMPADLSCLGHFMDPAGPTAVTAVDMIVKDFEKSTPVTGATVEVYTSLAEFNAQHVAATAGPTGADGKVTLMMPAGFYRVIFKTNADPAK